MKDTVRSRYLNEKVGFLVVGVIVIFIAFVMLAGKTQGWFEGSIDIFVRFAAADGESSNEQGSFGLEEGHEVRIRSTRAGQVVSIEPDDEGALLARLQIRKRFHRYVKKDSESLVKRSFGFVGDAYLEISGGIGDTIREGDTIFCYKDEEIMEIAQRAVDQIEASVVPMLNEATGVMSNANAITRHISEGDGIVGAAISDNQMKEDIKTSIKELNMLIVSAREAVYEATRLVKGAQKSWLVRNHIPGDDARDYISPLFPLYGQVDASLLIKCTIELQKARVSAVKRDVFRTAYNMAMCRIRTGEEDAAALLLQEAEIFGDKDLFSRLHIDAANIFLKRKSEELQNGIVREMLGSRKPKEMDDGAFSEFMALALLSGVQSDRETSVSGMRKFDRLIQRKGTEPARAAFFRAGAILASESAPLEAGQITDRESAALAEAGLPYAMAEALTFAGDYYILAERHDLASERYFSAGNSLLAQDQADRAAVIFERAYVSAQSSGNERLTSYLEAIRAINSDDNAN